VRLKPHPGPFRAALGARGETAAWDFLKKRGYVILEKNYKCKLGEIDVIAKRQGRLAFVEIKTRTTSQFGVPQEAVDLKKQAKIMKVTEWYLKEKKVKDAPVAFDVVAILWKEGRIPEINLLADAFEKTDSCY